MDENKFENIENDIYNVPIGKLPERYKVSRKTIYDRLKALKIKSVKKNKKLYITADDLQLMDELYTHMKAGGTLKNFVKQRIASNEILQEKQESQAIVTQPSKKMTPSQPQEPTATEAQEINQQGERLRTQKQQSIAYLRLGDRLRLACLAITVVTAICTVFLPIFSIVIGAAAVFLTAQAIATFTRSNST